MTQGDGTLAFGPDEGRALLVAGDPFVIKVDGADTQGAYSLVEVTVGLHGPPRHLHRNEDELWFIVSGEFDIEVGERTVRAGKGSVVFGPRGIPHHYTKASEAPGKLLEIFSPAGFERFSADIAGLADVERMRAIAAKYGMEMQTPPTIR